MKNNIILLYGGNSVEHEISILSALFVYKQYKGKYNLIPCYLKDSNFYIFKKLENIDTYKNFPILHKPIKFIANKNYIISKGKRIYFDAVLIVTHGINCEDGTIASYFKTLNIPFIAQDIYSASIGQNKVLSKKLCNSKVVPYYYINKNTFNHSLQDLIDNANKLGFPLIIKPNKLGSSVGISKVENIEELIDNIEYLFNLDDELLLEKYISSFYELNIAAIKYKDEIILSEIEKVSNSKLLTYDDKYVVDQKFLNENNKELPANISDKLSSLIKQEAKKIYTSLNAKYIVRMDFLYDLDNKKLYFNEINNIPGSLATYLFKYVNIDINKLIDMYIDEGLKDIDSNKKIISSYEKNIFKEVSFNNVKFNK